MPVNSFKNVLIGLTIILDEAFNFELKKEDIKSKFYSIFDHYDSNNDDKLDKTELEKIKLDMHEAAAGDEKENILNKKEIQNWLKNILPDEDIKPNILSGFLKEVEKNRKANVNNISDGVINYATQGPRGTCWIYSDLKSLSKTDWGAKAIKDSIIDDKENKKYIVNLKGVDFTCEISYAKAKRHFGGQGDIDARLIEMATQRYFRQEVKAGRMERGSLDVLWGGIGFGKQSMIYLLTGKNPNAFFFSYRMTDKEIDKKRKNFGKNLWQRQYLENVDNIWNLYEDDSKREFMIKLAQRIKTNTINCAFKSATKSHGIGNSQNADNEKSNDKDPNSTLWSKHEYSIDDIVIDDSGNILDIAIIDPLFPDEVIHKTLNEFIMQVVSIFVTDENEDYKELTTIAEPSWLRTN